MSDDFKNRMKKIESIEYANKNDLPYYTDNRGREYSMKTDRRVYHERRDGVLVMVDYKTGEIVYNYSLEKIYKENKENKEKAIKEGKRLWYVKWRDTYCSFENNKMYRLIHSDVENDVYTFALLDCGLDSKNDKIVEPREILTLKRKDF